MVSYKDVGEPGSIARIGSVLLYRRKQMEIECEICGTREAVTLADGMKMCADCRNGLRDEYEASIDIYNAQ